MAAIALILAVQKGIIPVGQAQKEAPAASALAVTVAEASMRGKVPKITLTGSIEGETSATVSAKIAGRIEQVLVQDGQRVTAGQPLVTLESVELANAVRMAQDAVTRAQANYDNVQADYQRYLTLYQQNAISRQMLDSVETRLKVAQADLSSAYANLSSARQQYGYATVTAPVDGIVANKTATIGQVVAAGMQLLTVEDINNVYAVVNIEQKDMGAVRVGQTAEITVDAYPDRTFTGKVAVINPAAGTSSRMFRTKIAIDNAEGLLKPGMFVKVQLITGEEASVLTVPQAALFQKQGLYYVYVVDGDKAVRRQVEIGAPLGDYIEIKSGLTAGQLVAITNVNKLKDGDAVFVAK